MINLDTNGFEDSKAALMECSCYIYNCFSEKDRQEIKSDWENAGGINNMPWWKWCIEHCHVSYDNFERNSMDEKTIREMVGEI